MGAAGKVAGAAKSAVEKAKGMVSKDKNKSEGDTVETKSMDRSFATDIVLGSQKDKTFSFTGNSGSEKVEETKSTKSYVGSILKR